MLSACRVEDLFEWIFEVDEDALSDDRGRIQIVVEYEMSSSTGYSTGHHSLPPAGAAPPPSRDHHRSSLSPASSSSSTRLDTSLYRMVENRITAHVDIQRDNTYAIVPVVKVRFVHC